MRAHLETILCKFGRDRAILGVVEVISEKKVYRVGLQTDGQTHRRTDKRQTPRNCITSWNELKM